MNFRSESSSIDFVVREIGGTKSTRTARLEIRGVPEIISLNLDRNCGDIMLYDGIKIGLTPMRTSQSEVDIFTDAPERYEMNTRTYSD
jgi:hypothetical protein